VGAPVSELGFPIATLTVNITGSIVMGVLAAIFAFKGGGPQHWRLFLTTGILGGYTCESGSRTFGSGAGRAQLGACPLSLI
jgi:fluoride ion exporter CrcB/FEX